MFIGIGGLFGRRKPAEPKVITLGWNHPVPRGVAEGVAKKLCLQTIFLNKPLASSANPSEKQHYNNDLAAIRRIHELLAQRKSCLVVGRHAHAFDNEAVLAKLSGIAGEKVEKPPIDAKVLLQTDVNFLAESSASTIIGNHNRLINVFNNLTHSVSDRFKRLYGIEIDEAYAPKTIRIDVPKPRKWEEGAREAKSDKELIAEIVREVNELLAKN